MKVETFAAKKDSLFEHELKRTSSASLFMLAHEVEVTGREPWFDQLSDNGTGLTNREELQALRADLARIEEGWTPSDGDLAQSPLLERWGVTELEGELLWRLCGRVSGFPGFRDGTELVSMQVLAIDVNLGWARDRVSLYRLGRPEFAFPPR